MGAAISVESGKEALAPGRVGHQDRVAELKRARPEPPQFWRQQGLRPHVVISTKFQEPWYSYSQDFKVLLMELGCTAYNPNTDNAETYKEKANDRWLLTFDENLEEVKRTKGFVLQIQQGATHDKSPMQLAEEKQAGWLQVPRIGVFSFEDSRTLVGGGTLAKEHMETALKQAEEQWKKGVREKLQMCSERYEAVDGGGQAPTDSEGNAHGRAKCTYANDDVYVGEWQHGKQHGKGEYTFAKGAVYNGEWQDGKQDGKGTFTYASGKFDLCSYVDGIISGEGVEFTKDRQKAWLLKDGKKVRELSPSEAAKKVQELGLSELLK